MFTNNAILEVNVIRLSQEKACLQCPANLSFGNLPQLTSPFLCDMEKERRKPLLCRCTEGQTHLRRL